MTSASDRAKGWYARAKPCPSSADFTPSSDALAFAVLLNAQADPEGFTMALFHSDLVVDARGRVLQLQPQDADALLVLAEKTTHLPDTGSFMNTWRVAHDRTSQKIDRLFVRRDGGELKETSVQGWDSEKTKLQPAVEEYEFLPAVLQELFSYIQEARSDYRPGEEENKDLIEQIKALVPA